MKKKDLLRFIEEDDERVDREKKRENNQPNPPPKPNIPMVSKPDVIHVVSKPVKQRPVQRTVNRNVCAPVLIPTSNNPCGAGVPVVITPSGGSSGDGISPADSKALSSSVSEADSAAVSAGTAASIADSKAVSAEDEAESIALSLSTIISSAISEAESVSQSESLLISEAQSTADSAGLAASVADSKAVSDSVNISTAQSTADSGGGGASTAQSTADSAGLAASVADSKAVSAEDEAESIALSQSILISVADSKAVSDSVAISTGISTAALTIDNLNGVLKATSGVVSGNASSTDLADGGASPADNFETRAERMWRDASYYNVPTKTGITITETNDWTDAGMTVRLRRTVFTRQLPTAWLPELLLTKVITLYTVAPNVVYKTMTYTYAYDANGVLLSTTMAVT